MLCLWLHVVGSVFRYSGVGKANGWTGGYRGYGLRSYGLRPRGGAVFVFGLRPREDRILRCWIKLTIRINVRSSPRGIRFLELKRSSG